MMKKMAVLAGTIMPRIWAVVISAVVLLLILFLNSHTQASLWWWAQIKSEGSEKMAAWVTALATCGAAIAVIIAWFQFKASRRSARFEIIQKRFNDPAMRFSRAAFAWGKLNPEEPASLNARSVPHYGWEIADFLNSVGKLLDKNEVEFEDIEMAYARHVLAICGNEQWEQRIGAEGLNFRYAPLLNLYRRMVKSGRIVDSVDELKVGIYDGPFWYSEMSLAPGEEIKNTVTKIRETIKKRISAHRA
jgi:hypothetical protein